MIEMNRLNNAFGQLKKNTGPSQKTHYSFMKRKPKKYRLETR